MLGKSCCVLLAMALIPLLADARVLDVDVQISDSDNFLSRSAKILVVTSGDYSPQLIRERTRAHFSPD